MSDKKHYVNYRDLHVNLPQGIPIARGCFHKVPVGMVVLGYPVCCSLRSIDALGRAGDQVERIMCTKSLDLAVLQGKFGQPKHEVVNESLLSPIPKLVADAKPRDAGRGGELLHANLKEWTWLLH
jgi:hypothetical protein